MLLRGGLDYVAVTDHNTIATAVALHQSLGERIIIGEEIASLEGDIIGLYITERIPAGLPALETARRIHAQGGLVYVPHPFENIRKGLGARVLTILAGEIDILEAYNGRSLGRGNRAARAWAVAHQLPAAASSDAHGVRGWGDTYSCIADPPTRDTLCVLLSGGVTIERRPRVRAVLYPKLHRTRRRLYSWLRKSDNKGGVS